MAKRSTKPVPTREEILSYDNVPYQVAARYIGWSDVTLRYALQQGTAPFGCVAKNPETGTYAYNVSPGMLVKYKDGDLQAWKLNDVINLARDGMQDVLNAQMDAMTDMLAAMKGLGTRKPFNREITIDGRKL